MNRMSESKSSDSVPVALVPVPVPDAEATGYGLRRGIAWRGSVRQQWQEVCAHDRAGCACRDFDEPPSRQRTLPEVRVTMSERPGSLHVIHARLLSAHRELSRTGVRSTYSGSPSPSAINPSTAFWCSGLLSF